VLREDELPDEPPAALGAYDQSKWVAEQVVALARERGIPVAVYRPPRVGGDSRSGTWRSRDVVCHLIRACAVTGMVPDAGMAVDIVPVDYLAAAIARLARRREALGRNFHFAAPRKVPLTLLAEALPASGYPARLAEPGEWYAAVRRHADEEPGGGLGLVLTMFRRQLGQGAAAPAEPEFDCANTAALLGEEPRCPEVDAALLGSYVGSLASSGFLPKPADHGRS
jgi:nucleoside-diphosphate-sugar epimerase